MGLDCSHNAWSGAYSRFDRFRSAICTATGGKWPKLFSGNEWSFGEGYSEETHPGLYALLTHSDCEGVLAPTQCSQVADELEKLLPKINGEDFKERAVQFIKGCRDAASADEELEFF